VLFYFQDFSVLEPNTKVASQGRYGEVEHGFAWCARLIWYLEYLFGDPRVNMHYLVILELNAFIVQVYRLEVI
jgi:hypothetical protein